MIIDDLRSWRMYEEEEEEIEKTKELKLKF